MSDSTKPQPASATVLPFPRKKNHVSDAERYRLLQAAALLKIYETEVGRPAKTTTELGMWRSETRSGEGPINPYEILTDEEIKNLEF